MRFAETSLDDVFTSLTVGRDRCLGTIVDPGAGCRVELHAADARSAGAAALPHCVVYNPGHRQAICLEPYTCVPGMFGGEEWPIEKALHVLPPGQEARLGFSIHLCEG